MVARGELVARTGATLELLRRLERARLLRPIGRSSVDLYYPAEARQQVERVQTLLAAGYAERDVAVVVGKVIDATRTKAEVVVELAQAAVRCDGSEAEVMSLCERGLAPVWAVTEGGRTLLAESDLPLVGALNALAVIGRPELQEELSAAWSERPGQLSHAELDAEIRARLEALRRAEAVLGLGLGQLERRRPGAMEARPARGRSLSRLLPRRRRGRGAPTNQG